MTKELREQVVKSAAKFAEQVSLADGPRSTPEYPYGTPRVPLEYR